MQSATGVVGECLLQSLRERKLWRRAVSGSDLGLGLAAASSAAATTVVTECSSISLWAAPQRFTRCVPLCHTCTSLTPQPGHLGVSDSLPPAAKTTSSRFEELLLFRETYNTEARDEE